MTDHASAPTQQSDTADDEISLLDLLIVIAKHKRLIIVFPIVVAVLAAGISFLLPNIYTATTKIMPPQQSQSGTAGMLAQLGGLAGLAGGVAGIKSPNDLYIGMLKSRTVADNLIQRFELNARYEEKYQSNTRKVLEKLTSISTGKDGIIVIEVEDKDPKRAAELANAYVDELFNITRVLAVTEASQRRLFFERQFEQAKDNLTKAESAARQGLEKGGLVQVEGQGRALVEMTARLRGQITVKEVQLGAMRSFATELNPDFRLLQNELAALRHELSKLEGAAGGAVEVAPDTKSRGSDNLKLLRNVKYYETIYELLAKQYEIAKIDEARDSAVVQVMDKAVEPDRKSKPKRSLIVLLSGLLGFSLSIIWILLCEAVERAKGDAQQAARLLKLKQVLSFK